MDLYFSCSLTGGRGDQPAYAAIVDFLLAQGHQVLTAHLARPEVMAEEKTVDPLAVFQRDIAWLDACDAVVAEVSTPSHGVGYEVAYALGLGKPVLCLHHREARVSKMITGNTAPSLIVRAYASQAEALERVQFFLLEILPKMGVPGSAGP